MKIENATKYENGNITALLDTEGLVGVNNVTIVRAEDGSIKAYPPTRPYTAKNGTKGYEKIVFFKNFEEADAEAARMVEEQDDKFYPFREPMQIKGGQKLGLATLQAHIALKVSVLPATADKAARLIIPTREYNKKLEDGKTERKTGYYVWPFTQQGDELKTEIAALTEQIIAEAKPYEPKKNVEGE